MKNSVIAIQPCVITTIIVYALLAPIFFEPDNALREGETLVVNNDDETMMYSQQLVVDTKECKSPCPSSAEMCIEMCA